MSNNVPFSECAAYISDDARRARLIAWKAMSKMADMSAWNRQQAKLLPIPGRMVLVWCLNHTKRGQIKNGKGKSAKREKRELETQKP